MLFEVSWEVCNMVGGIHTVIATKVKKMQELYEDNYIVVGPDFSQNRALEGVFEDDVWDEEMQKSLSTLPVKTRMGRWLVPGNPKCLLVEFGAIFKDKDQILAGYWERFGLNSLSGGYDYLEPVMFAQAAGMAIERLFYSSLFPRGVEVVAHCHEWLACALMLYLKERTPEIGTVFTTHATTLGRALSSRHIDFEELALRGALDPDRLAHDYQVVAKHSLEVVSARIADTFTTVSPITASECELFLGTKPKLLTLNGMDDATPDPQFLEPARVLKTRHRLLELATRMTGSTYDEERTTLLLSSGRYEFENKGIDVTLEALARLNQKLSESPIWDPRDRVISFLMFPAGHTGPREAGVHSISTHGLSDEAHDPIMRRCDVLGLKNLPQSRVHVIFVPIYLNGNDPLIHETYYELLAGADMTLFPSFYEPWGYTPMESAAAGVPTITSDLAGFGIWASRFGDWTASGVHVLKRKGIRPEVSREELCDRIVRFINLTRAQKDKLKEAILETSRKARWSAFGQAYQDAHTHATAKAEERMESATYDRFRAFSHGQTLSPTEGVTTAAHARHFTVKNKMPAQLVSLKKLISHNLWWSWNQDVSELLSELNPTLWTACRQDPLKFFEQIDYQLLESAARSKSFLSRVEKILARFNGEMSSKQKPEIAYFCMEYGISHLLRNYSGGLGILAGDHLKSASDTGTPLCAIGMAYHYGYFQQRITSEGKQHSLDEAISFSNSPMQPVLTADGERLRIEVEAPGRTIWCQVWQVSVGRVDLYLLDTDLAENTPEDRGISDRLYGGGSEHRLKQEFVLALGGHALLGVLKLSPKVFHMNEGHTAFLVLARIAELMRDQKLRYSEALEYVRHSMVFTTHTPVPAGHDQFPDEMVAPFLALFEKTIGQGVPRALGRGLDRNRDFQFSMTGLAVRGSIHINGVSRIHGDVSRRMFHSLTPQLHPYEVPVLSITNGVHAPTWVSNEWQKLFQSKLGSDWKARLVDKDFWSTMHELDAEAVWNTHLSAKRTLVQWLRGHLRESWTRRKENPAHLATAIANLNEQTFIATFARRFAPYKRANLLFSDPARLAKMLSGPTPIVLLFSGKAHPSDTLGQNLITNVIEFARRPEFVGKIIFVENYEIDVAKLLVSGSDIWINNPLRPLEASGTSGMKAAMNGCLNLSVPDGWWAEGYNGKNGWVIGDESMTESPDYQDTFDSAQLYALFEQEILPRFNRRNAQDIPESWVDMMKDSIASILPAFNTERMISEYRDNFYVPASQQAEGLQAEQFREAKQLSSSRSRLLEHWNSIAFADIDVQGLDGNEVPLGSSLKMRVRMTHQHIQPQDLQVQAVVSLENNEQTPQAFLMQCLTNDERRGESVWEGNVALGKAGPQLMGVRVTPRACHATHPMDLTLDLVKWL